MDQSAQHGHTIGDIPRLTPRLSNLSYYSLPGSGVLLRRVVLLLSHLRRLGASLRLMVLNYSQVRAQSLVTGHPVQHRRT